MWVFHGYCWGASPRIVVIGMSYLLPIFVNYRSKVTGSGAGIWDVRHVNQSGATPKKFSRLSLVSGTGTLDTKTGILPKGYRVG